MKYNTPMMQDAILKNRPFDQKTPTQVQMSSDSGSGERYSEKFIDDIIKDPHF